MLRMGVVMSLWAAVKRADAADTPSPNAVIAKPQCDSSKTVSLRYSSGSERLYVESGDGSSRGGCTTLTDIWKGLDGSAPLYAVDPASGAVTNTATGTWLLTEHLWIEDGITLEVTFIFAFFVFWVEMARRSAQAHAMVCVSKDTTNCWVSLF